MYQRLRNVWLRISLKWKLAVYAMILVLLLSVSAAFNFRLMDFAPVSYTHLDVYKRQLFQNLDGLGVGHMAEFGIQHAV